MSLVTDLGGRKYPVIACDPPWNWQAYSAKGEDRSAKQHYQIMNLEDICRLPVEDVAEKDAVLLLWCINSMLPQALLVMQRWGFTFKTIAFTWAKLNRQQLQRPTQPFATVGEQPLQPSYFMGLGYWTRQNTEMCLLGTRGKPARVSCGVRQLIVAPRREHSRKPQQFYDSTMQLLQGPYLELFAREQRLHWTAWGLETQKYNEVA